ncbi:hypothetical protein COV23_01790, partial [Candidatus Wolfebacteria bacterium CG10_big_fil_rev_8_21_14_0_10_31_9]
MITIESLKMLIQDILWNIPRCYRCYEITRTLNVELSRKGVDFKIMDGVVFYYALTFFSEAKRGNCNLRLRNLEEDVRECIRSARLSMKIGESKFLSPETLYWRL